MASDSSIFGRYQFLIRRLHSLCGLVPVGAFMCVHLLANSSIQFGGDFFQEQVDKIHALGPALPVIEWVFIFIPLLFHMLLGFVFIFDSKSNIDRYKYIPNYRYTLQRATGMIAAVLIFAHVLHMHHYGKTMNLSDYGFGAFDPHDAANSAAAAIQSGVAGGVIILYAIGVLSCVFHLANGIWTMGITWGVWISPDAQQRASKICAAFGVALAIVGCTAIYGFATYEVRETPVTEANVSASDHDHTHEDGDPHHADHSGSDGHDHDGDQDHPEKHK